MPPLSILIKPASGLCNLRCDYCFYHDVISHREKATHKIMAKETSQEIIKKALAFADGDSIAFAFQGGEPLIAGLDYFEHFVKTLKDLNHKKSPIYFSIQTNGTLIAKEWARFFGKEKFLVGLSLDGDRHANRFRKTADGQGTYFKIIKAAEMLEKYKVDFNILTVLTGYCAENATEIYKFFRQKGFKYLQFIPCLRPFGDKSESELFMTPDQYTTFLINIFQLYVKDYVRGQYISIRLFDNYVRLFLGQATEQCGMAGHCTFQFAIESNGNVYPCDFYCLDGWLLGNINQDDFEDFTSGEKQRAFIKESLYVPPACKECQFYFICKAGGCKRQRQDRDYCQSYKAFFNASLPLFRVFAGEKDNR